jgi:uncharacterized protein YndB with AHSA1/START domain
MTAGRIAVNIVKDFDVPPERVFDAWLDPAMVAHWFAPGLGEMVRGEIDARQGGTFHLDQRRGDGIARHWGTYLEMDRPRRLVFTWWVDGAEGEDIVTIDMAPAGSGCRVTVTHEMDARFADYAGRTGKGWAAMLDGLSRGVGRIDPHATVVGSGAVRFDRLLPGPVERVWAYLTESDKRARWLAAGTIEPRVGTSFEFRFDHAGLSPEIVPTPERFRRYDGGLVTRHEVTRFEPPHVLGLTWGGGSEGPSEVVIELSQEGDRVRLVLIHRRLGGPGAMANVAGGWHTHLAILADRLEGRTPPSFWRLFEGVEETYAQRLAGTPSER